MTSHATLPLRRSSITSSSMAIVRPVAGMPSYVPTCGARNVRVGDDLVALGDTAMNVVREIGEGP